MAHFFNSTAFSQYSGGKYIRTGKQFSGGVTVIFSESSHKIISSVLKKFHVNTPRNKKKFAQSCILPYGILLADYGSAEGSSHL